MRYGEFNKLDHGDFEKNVKAYGQGHPPSYDIKKVKGFNISMICGKDDLLVSPEDYNWLHEELIENGNKVNFFEYDLGHQGV